MIFIAWITLIIYILGVGISIHRNENGHILFVIPLWGMNISCLIYLIMLL